MAGRLISASRRSSLFKSLAVITIWKIRIKPAVATAGNATANTDRSDHAERLGVRKLRLTHRHLSASEIKETEIGQEAAEIEQDQGLAVLSGGRADSCGVFRG